MPPLVSIGPLIEVPGGKLPCDRDLSDGMMEGRVRLKTARRNRVNRDAPQIGPAGRCSFRAV